MIPHRAKLALAAAACCAFASCLDARHNVPVSVIIIGKNQNADTMKRIDLRVYKAAPMLDDDHPQYARCAGEHVETEKTDMGGKAAFSLLPGDYEICTGDQLYDQETFKWSVPFKVTDEGLRVPQLVEDAVTYVGCGRVEQGVRLLRWEYVSGGGGNVNELLLTRDNATDRTHPPPPTPAPCSSPTPPPSPTASPTAEASPTTQASPPASPATTAASPAPTASTAASPTPTTLPAPPRGARGARRRRG